MDARTIRLAGHLRNVLIAMAALLYALFSRSEPSSQPIRLALTTSDKANFLRE